jgi:choline dehydrogenase-like flavoprotein
MGGVRYESAVGSSGPDPLEDKRSSVVDTSRVLHPRTWDAVVIGSGFGGALAAHPLVDAGLSVAMLERGDRVRRGGRSWSPESAGVLTPHYSTGAAYWFRRSRDDRSPHDASHRDQPVGAFFCVGGQSIFYGGVSLRFREHDFEPDAELAGDSAAAWPIGYHDLEPHYSEVERLLGVTGVDNDDPTDPPRTGAYRFVPDPLTPFSARIAAAATSLGLRPFRIPVAFNRDPASNRPTCISCNTCDCFACAIGAKNDLAVTVLPDLLDRGMQLWPGSVVLRVLTKRGRAVGVECVDRVSRRAFVVRADRVILAAGTLATPQLLLASGLARFNPAGDLIGRYLTRHYNTAVVGVFDRPTNPEENLLKQIGVHDFYGAPGGGPKLGGIQQIAIPPVDVVSTQVPKVLQPMVELLHSRLGALLTMTEDQPQYENRIELDPTRADEYGLPGIVIRHRYSERDRRLGKGLADHAGTILARAGARFFYRHRIETFSHALGTVRMGADPTTAPLDPDGRFRGVEQLWVADGSTLPTSAAVNPSLTIAANAARVGRGIAMHPVGDRHSLLEGLHHAH